MRSLSSLYPGGSRENTSVLTRGGKKSETENDMRPEERRRRGMQRRGGKEGEREKFQRSYTVGSEDGERGHML